MIFYSVLFISFFIVALIIRFKRFTFYSLAENSLALVNDLITDIDEDAKLKLVQHSNNKLVYSLFKMLLVIIVAFLAGSVPVIVYIYLRQTNYQSLVFTSFYSILFISLGATIPFLIPLGKKKETGYSELSQLLHRLALNNYNIAYKLFKRETKKIRKQKLERRPDFVIISGLARAGTTSLMNDLAEIEDFVSLSYANMPFLMCPNIWKKFYNPKETKLKERSHKDGIMIGLDSNEALEEFFFKVKANDAYIHENYISEYNLSEDDYNDYLDYQSIIKLDNNKIYLAKNNNFILRYRNLREFNDDFIMVILYRDPLTHAASLLEKHRDYKKLQQDDPFVLEYMNWLGHHEFGQNQKQFVFNGSAEVIEGDKESLDYWLKIWTNYYRYVLDIKHPNTLLINYDTFCKNPGDILKKVLNKTGIKRDLPDYKPFNNNRKTDHEFSEDVFQVAKDIYDQLCN